MQEKQLNRKSLLVWILVLILIPATLLAAWRFGDRKFYLTSVLMIFYSFLPFFVRLEMRRPQPRELVTIAVLSAIAVASRAAFAMIPHFKPMSGIIMISAMALGPEAGFLIGAISAFASNFLFGQGPWTPWQMFAYGAAGLLAGYLYHKGIIHEKKKLKTALIGAILIVAVVGPILDTCSLFTMGGTLTLEWAASVYLSGLYVNLIHGAASFATLFLLTEPMLEKLQRIQQKYGMMEG